MTVTWVCVLHMCTLCIMSECVCDTVCMGTNVHNIVVVFCVRTYVNMLPFDTR